MNLAPISVLLKLLCVLSATLIWARPAETDGPQKAPTAPPRAGNPVFSGWYADPEAVIFGKRYWIYPTFSAAYDQQVFFDAFSSPDLIQWTKHSRILDTNRVTWARRAMWAPAAVERNGKYYLFFSANDVHQGEVGGIGVAVADRPEGPFQDLLGKPLLNEIVHGAQPIDQFLFQDQDGQDYLIYGGWRHCNVVRLKPDFTGFLPFSDGSTFKEITPDQYVEGPFMFRKDGKYYFMWSEGGWTGPNYSVAYAIGNSPLGPFKRIGKVLQQDPTIATGAGHHSVLHVPNTDRWFIVYHRRPLGETKANHRVTCIDEMHFDEQGLIQPVKITHEGVSAMPLAELSAQAPQLKTLRVAGAQLAVTRDVKKNLDAITRALEFARREKADVLITPEGSLSGYTAQFDAAATTEALNSVIQRARQAAVGLVLGTCFEDADGARYDAQRFYDATGEYLGFHSKVLLCRRMDEPQRKGEVDFFKSAPLRTFQLRGLTVGGLICNDMWANPEWTPMPDPYLARNLAQRGARLIFLSVNSGQAEGSELALHRAFHESNLQLRARSAKVWVVVANAADPLGRLEANCHSGVLSPEGRWILQANPAGEQFFVHTITFE